MAGGGADQSPTSSSSSWSQMSCQVRIIRAENVEEIISSKKRRGGSLFVRTYLSAGGNNKAKVKLDTRGLVDESYTLECKGMLESINQLKRGSVSFELRWRPTTASTSGWARSSRLLSRAELPWGPAFSSLGSEVQAWVPLGSIPFKSFVGSAAPAAGLLVAMTVNVKVEDTVAGVAPVPSEAENRMTRRKRGGGQQYHHSSCTGCGKGGGCQDNYDLFVLAASFEAF